MAHRINTFNAQPDRHGSGKSGFHGGNPNTGARGTDYNESFSNMVQEEICGPAELAAITLQEGNYRQLSQALRRLGGLNTTTISSTTTLTLDHTGLIYVDATAGAVNLTLPKAAALRPAGSAEPGLPIRYRIIRTDTVAHVVTLKPAAGDKCGRGTTGGPILVGADVEVVSDGVNDWLMWHRSRGALAITAGGSFVAPATQLDVWVTGGGGAAGHTYNGRIGGGGGGGHTARALVRTKFGETINVTIGIGAPPQGPGGVNSNGGTTVFGAHLTASGGVGGVTGSGGRGGGAGTVGPDAQLIGSYLGGDGVDGGTTGVATGGSGGASFWGGAARSFWEASYSTQGYGGGGSARWDTTAYGTAGKSGYVQVEW